jgi:hypothetical protein
VLNYLRRGGQLVGVGSGSQDRMLLGCIREEAEFFGLRGLVVAVDNQLAVANANDAANGADATARFEYHRVCDMYPSQLAKLDQRPTPEHVLAQGGGWMSQEEAEEELLCDNEREFYNSYMASLRDAGWYLKQAVPVQVKGVETTRIDGIFERKVPPPSSEPRTHCGF